MIKLNDAYGRTYSGAIEFEFRDRNGLLIATHRQPNLIKIFMKEVLAHRLAHDKVWDPTAGTGSGAWVSSDIDAANELSAKYIVFGASFDSDGNPLSTADERYYTFDSASGRYVRKPLGAGAEYDGGLINAIPISEPLRPLKRIERVYFEPSYQPSGVPLLQDDVRGLNNQVVMETTLRQDEYNGFGTTDSDYFTITEIALVAGKELGAVGDCELDPHDLFLEGSGSDGRTPILANATGTATVTIDPSESSVVNVIKEGDQVKVVDAGGTVDSGSDLDQVSPYYLVLSKNVGGSDVLLDRAPVSSAGVPITGAVGLLKDGFRVLAHSILKAPAKKSADFSIVTRWVINMA